MLPGYVNQLLLAVKYYTTGQVVHVRSLTKNHSYPVVGARRVTGLNGCPAIVFTLQSDYWAHSTDLPSQVLCQVCR